MALADEDSPAFMLGGFQLAASRARRRAEAHRAFRTGEGVGWHEHDHGLFGGTERFFRPGYRANLVHGVDPGARRRRGQARAPAPGSPTSAAATAPRRSSWPRPTRARRSSASTTTRPRSRPPSRAPSEAGLGDRVSFEVAGAQGLPRRGLRPRLLLRLPARHGRPGRARSRTCARRSRRTAP